MDLIEYMEHGVADIKGRLAGHYLKSDVGRKFLFSFAAALNKSSALRRKSERAGEHVPQFLICSITSSCNLHCAGCYARAQGACTDADAEVLSAGEWGGVFTQAAKLGVSFILLAGGEPLMRRDVLEEAAKERSIAFPVFTNGTMLDDAYIDFFAQHPNMIPVLSIEGDAAETDARRGEGVSRNIESAMQRLRDADVLYAASVTVTTKNMHSVSEASFIEALRAQGCEIVFFIEYVPAQSGTEGLALGEDDAAALNQKLDALRASHTDMCVFSFPGDEKYTDGCLAAGRGFFHINARGGAEPCPFSPYSVMNVKENTLREVLSSDYFAKVRAASAQTEGHSGGCTLFSIEKEISALRDGGFAQ